MTNAGSQRYKFLTLEWIDAFRKYATSKVTPEDLAGVDCTVSMEFTDAPKHLVRPGSDGAGYYIRVRGGKLEIGDHPLLEADVHAVGDYEFMRKGQPLNMQEDRKYMQENPSKYKIIGDISPVRNIFIKIDIREGFYNKHTAV